MSAPAAGTDSVSRQSPRNGMAQAFHHAILPLASLADRRTEVRWGLRDFELRFGRRRRGPVAARDRGRSADAAGARRCGRPVDDPRAVAGGRGQCGHASSVSRRARRRGEASSSRSTTARCPRPSRSSHRRRRMPITSPASGWLRVSAHHCRAARRPSRSSRPTASSTATISRSATSSSSGSSRHRPTVRDRGFDIVQPRRGAVARSRRTASRRRPSASGPRGAAITASPLVGGMPGRGRWSMEAAAAGRVRTAGRRRSTP